MSALEMEVLKAWPDFGIKLELSVAGAETSSPVTSEVTKPAGNGVLRVDSRVRGQATDAADVVEPASDVVPELRHDPNIPFSDAREGQTVTCERNAITMPKTTRHLSKMKASKLVSKNW